MDYIFNIDWEHTFAPQTPLLEIFLRGTLTYLALYLMLRFSARKSGSISTTDLLVLVLIADAAQNAMADNYASIPDGILLVATIFFWSWFLDWLGYRFPRLEKLVHPPPIKVVDNGQVIQNNMRKGLLTKEELLSELRLSGISNLSEVKEMYIEGDGKISVIKAGDGSQQTSKTKQSSQQAGV